MAGKWKPMALAEAVDLISGGTPKTRVPQYWGGSIPWLSVSDFNTGYRWVSSTEKFITERGLAESATKILNVGDIIISARGTVGALAQLARPMAFNQSCYGIRGKQGIADTNYIYYLLRNIVSVMKQVAHGAVFDTITRDTFNIIQIQLPPLNEQQAIACILGALDDKIEMNRCLNQTLEEMARAIFKSWFVDFDGCTEFQDSEVGEIPKEWALRPLLDLCELKRGYDLPMKNREPGNFPIISSSGRSDSHVTYKVKAPGIVTGRYGTIGQVFYIEDDFWPLNTTLYIVNFKGNIPRFIYYTLCAIDYQKYNDKAAVPGINRNHVHKEMVVIPPVKVQDRFADLLSPMWQKQATNRTETNTLSKLRDTLLPRLISGVLQVPDAERIVGRCV
jgi:type I restriction enzyme S subunit